ncbi:MAG TPA: GNAT family N-acetyltransferase [Spirochaetota bacterium]|nr:GNAT family N-acetyltransferase [Spirochaetota bacterium]
MADQSHIRRAHINDIGDIYEVIRENPTEVLPRSYQDILRNFDRFHVYDDGGVQGVISYQVMPVFDIDNPDFAIEIVSFSVKRASQGKGIGRVLLRHMVRVLDEMDPHRVIVLTFYPDFFRKHGFSETSKENLYQKIYQGCLNCTKYRSPLTCPEVAMEMVLRK